MLASVIKSYLPEIQRLCQAHKIARLWAFGSVLREDFRPNSDVDLLYEQLAGLSIEEQGHHFWALKDKLEALLGRRVDLVWDTGVQNDFFREEIDETKQLIYEQEEQKIPG